MSSDSFGGIRTIPMKNGDNLMWYQRMGQPFTGLRRAAIAAGALIAMSMATPAWAESLLDIPPVPESAPDQAWAAIAEMVMVYYDVPNTGPGDMQCSIAYFLTGTPNCYKAQDESEFTAVSRAIKGYPQFAHESFGELPIAMRWEEAKTISPDDVIQEIRFERPILVQIEPARNEGEAKVRAEPFEAMELLARIEALNPAVNRPVRIAQERPARLGWEANRVFTYETSPNEHRVLFATARHGARCDADAVGSPDPLC